MNQLLSKWSISWLAKPKPIISITIPVCYDNRHLQMCKLLRKKCNNNSEVFSQTNFKIFHMFMGAAILKIRLKDEIITNEV